MPLVASRHGCQSSLLVMLGGCVVAVPASAALPVTQPAVQAAPEFRSESKFEFSLNRDTQVLQPALVAVRVNHIQYRYDDIYQHPTQPQQFVLQLDSVLALLGLSRPAISDEQPTLWRISTPIGEAGIRTQAAGIIHSAGVDYITPEVLSALGIRYEYQAADLRLDLYVPWDVQSPASTQTQPRYSDSASIDYQPATAAVNELSLQYAGQQHTVADGSRHSQQLQLGSSGSVLGWQWGLRTQSSDSSQSDTQYMQVDNLYASRADADSAVRVGINRSSLHGMGGLWTGISYAHSNQGIGRHLDSFDSRSQGLLRGDGRDLRHIRGQGSAGGVAELRVNGRAVARVRIALDGQYEFLNLDAGMLNPIQDSIEVAVYPHALSQQPEQVQRIVLGRRRATVATDEWLLETGVGLSGNALQTDASAQQDLNAHLVAEYGVSNQLALRAGLAVQPDDRSSSYRSAVSPSRAWSDDLSWMLGGNLSLGAYSNADVSYQHVSTQGAASREVIDASIDYQREQLQLSYQLQHSNTHRWMAVPLADSDGWAHDVTDTPHAQLSDGQDTDMATADHLVNSYGYQRQRLPTTRHSITANYQPNTHSSARISVYEDRDKQAGRQHYFTAAVHTQLTPNSRLSIYRDRDNDYGYTASTQTADRQHGFSLAGDAQQHVLGWQYRPAFASHTDLGVDIHKYHGNDQLLYQGYLQHRFDDRSELLAGISHHAGRYGWLGEWRYRLPNSALNWVVGVRDNHQDRLSSHDDRRWSPPDERFAYFRLEMQMRNLPRQGLVLDRYRYQPQGTLVIELAHDASLPLPEQLRLRLGASSVLARRIAAGIYVVDAVPAGVYVLQLDSRDLPFDYGTDHLPTPTIRMAAATVTTVPLQLNRSLGMVGRLVDGASQQQIRVMYQGTVLAQAVSDDYGFFQLTGLGSGHYQLLAEGYQPLAVTLSDADIFGIELEPLNSSH